MLQGERVTFLQEAGTILTQKIANSLARTGMAVAVAVGFVLSAAQITFDYRDQLRRNDALVDSILYVASGGVTQAAFELSTAEAEAALQPLMIHDFFTSVEVLDEGGSVLAEISRETAQYFTDTWATALFTPDKQYEETLFHQQSNLDVGTLRVSVHTTTIFRDFYNRSIRTIMVGLLRSIILAAILLYIFNRLLTRPIVALVENLKAVDPRKPQVIMVPERISEANNELTELASSTNSILASSEEYLAELDTAKRETDEVAEKLRHTERLSIIGRLVGGVSHDFNNILAVILGSLELLEATNDLNGDAKKLVNMGLSATERGAKLTSQLLSYSRRQPLDPKPILIQGYFQNLETLLARVLGEQYDIEFVVPEGHWFCFADANQLESVILNLAINARDAMPNGGKLTIEAFSTPLDETYCAQQDEAVEPGQYICFAVTDNGTGMSEDVLKQAFEPFFTTKEIGKGSGLGLSMVYGFIKQSDGHIKIYSEVGVGTTIKLYLPRTSQTGETVSERVPGVGIDASALVNTQLLVVEDDEAYSRVIELTMSGLQINALVTHDAETALQAVRNAGPFDAALIDVVLPGELNGRQLADRLRIEFPDIKIAFMSGYTENAIIHNNRLDEGTIFIQKPFSINELKTVLNNILKKGES